MTINNAENLPLSFVVHQRDQIVAAFADRNGACEWARLRSFGAGCCCTVSTRQGVLDIYDDGQFVAIDSAS